MILKKLKLNKKPSKFNFPVPIDLVAFWAESKYGKQGKYVFVLLNSKQAFTGCPGFAILKRDNLKVFLQGEESKYCFIICDTEEEAKDYSYQAKNTPWAIFYYGVMIESMLKGFE